MGKWVSLWTSSFQKYRASHEPELRCRGLVVGDAVPRSCPHVLGGRTAACPLLPTSPCPPTGCKRAAGHPVTCTGGELKDSPALPGLCVWCALSECDPARVTRGCAGSGHGQGQGWAGWEGSNTSLRGTGRWESKPTACRPSPGGASRQTQMLEPTWEEKAKKTNNVIQCPQKGMIISQRGLKAPAGPRVGLSASWKGRGAEEMRAVRRT